MLAINIKGGCIFYTFVIFYYCFLVIFFPPTSLEMLIFFFFLQDNFLFTQEISPGLSTWAVKFICFFEICIYFYMCILSVQFTNFRDGMHIGRQCVQNIRTRSNRSKYKK